MRLGRDDYFLGIAEAVARRATCPRKHVGAIIVSADRHILSTGYNGSLPGQPHCEDEDVGCLMEDGHCVRTIHAEANAILHARAPRRRDRASDPAQEDALGGR